MGIILVARCISVVHLRRCSARNARHSSVVAHSQMVIGLSVTVRITFRSRARK